MINSKPCPVREVMLRWIRALKLHRKHTAPTARGHKAGHVVLQISCSDGAGFLDVFFSYRFYTEEGDLKRTISGLHSSIDRETNHY
jgi:hypothetical protein